MTRSRLSVEGDASPSTSPLSDVSCTIPSWRPDSCSRSPLTDAQRNWVTATPSPRTAKANARLAEYKNDVVHFNALSNVKNGPASAFSKKHINSSPMEHGNQRPLPSQQSLHATISMLQDEVKMLRKRLQFATDELKRREIVNQPSPSHEMRVITRQLEVEKEKASKMSSPELEPNRRSPAGFSAEAALMAQCRVLADQLKNAKLETAQLRKDLALAIENVAETKLNAESASSAKQKLEYELGRAARELQSMELDLERSMNRVTDLSADNKELRRTVRQQEERLRELQAINAEKTIEIANLESRVSLLWQNSQEKSSNAQPPIGEDKPALPQDKALEELRKELENKDRHVMCLSEDLEKERRRVAELQRQVWDQAIEIDELHCERRKSFETEAEVVRLRGKVEYLEEALTHARKGVMTAQVDTATKRKEGRRKEESDVFDDDVFELYSGKSIARNDDRRGAEETWLMDVNEV